jgi:uracil-DNA glycosylase
MSGLMLIRDTMPQIQMKTQLAEAPNRVRRSRKTPPQTAAPLIPNRPTLPRLSAAAAYCRACPLWKRGTQTVFGEGLPRASVIFIGEQPGFEEDLVGKPFVGPAGKVLDKGLVAAGIERSAIYVTNMVKHFKWEPKGNQHLHKKPNAAEVAACRPWLDAELEVLKPTVLVCLGATAAQGLLGRDFRVSQQRGQLVQSPLAPYVMATVHPSSVLRAPDTETRHREMKLFINDLKKIAKLIRTTSHPKQAAA